MSESNDFCYYWSLSLENVRCFGPAQTLELHRDGKVAKWVVLLGDNGVGKTTVLQCLYAMKPTLTELAQGLSASQPALINWSRWPGDDRLSREVLSRDLHQVVNVDTIVVRGEHLYSANYQASSSRNQTLGYSADAPLSMFICSYGGSRKSNDFQTVEQLSSDEPGTLFDERATLLSTEQWYIEYDYAAARTNSEQAKDRLTVVRKTLIDLLPDVDDLRITGLDAQPPRPTLEAHTPYGWVRVRDLSLGYRTLMAWVVDFAARMFARYPTSPNPLAEPAVCLVDEIDLHLHPAWQRKLIAYLDERFPATQFIVTAHSPLVVQAAEHAKVAVLRRHEGEDFVTIHNDLESVRGWRVDQILTSDLFGLDGSRSPRINDLERERATILGKPALNDADRARLDELKQELEALPHGDTSQDREAWDLVRRIAASKRAGTGGA